MLTNAEDGYNKPVVLKSFSKDESKEIENYRNIEDKTNIEDYPFDILHPKNIINSKEKIIESYKEDTGILDSGNRTEFSSGAVRDIQDDKGDEYLLPFIEIGEMISYYLDRDNNDTKNYYIMFNDIMYNLSLYKDNGNINHLISILDIISIYVYNYDTPEAIMQLAIHFKNGAKKYSPRNWEKGMPVSNYISSFIRHLLKFIRGDKDEHHERAILWNIICAIWTIRNHPELNDFYRNKEENGGD